jgi:ATP-dependent RNA helicase DDX27
MVTALAQFTDIRVEAIIGGSNSLKEQRKLTSAPDILIATPGRMLDHLKNTRGVSLDYVQFLVLDEADRLLDMGFRDEVLGILAELPAEHQTTLTSATLSGEVDRFAKDTLKHPVKVTRGKDKLDVPASLQAFIVRMQEGWTREAVLLTLLTDYFKSQVIVFFHTKKQCHRFWLILNELNLSAAEIQGDLSQAQRLTAISAFQSSQVDFLIATDLASRGLDLPVAAVINCQVPKEAKRLIHRMGRTARAGESGMSVTLCSDQERTMLKKAVKGMKVKAIKMPAEKVQKWGKKVEKLRQKISDKLAEEEAEKEFHLADIETQKAQNFIIHSDEIYNRPRREWIHSKEQKEVLKKSNFEGEENVERRIGERDVRDKVSGNPLMVKNSRAMSRGMKEKDVKKKNRKDVKKNRKDKTHVRARKTVGKAFKSEKRYKRR